MKLLVEKLKAPLENWIISDLMNATWHFDFEGLKVLFHLELFTVNETNGSFEKYYLVDRHELSGDIYATHLLDCLRATRLAFKNLLNEEFPQEALKVITEGDNVSTEGALLLYSHFMEAAKQFADKQRKERVV